MTLTSGVSFEEETGSDGLEIEWIMVSEREYKSFILHFRRRSSRAAQVDTQEFPFQKAGDN